MMIELDAQNLARAVRAGRPTSSDRLDPVTGAAASNASAAIVTSVEQAVVRAGEAFAQWSQLCPTARRGLLMEAADSLEAKADQLVEAMMGGIGATEEWARANLAFAVRIVREAAMLTTQIAGEMPPSSKPASSALPSSSARSPSEGA